jgi:hypothetical protein
MTRLLPWRVGIVWLASVLLLSTIAGAQQKAQSVPQRNEAYDPSREVSVQGSVISHSETSTVAPFGSHVTLQTSAGVLDIPLGDARLLESDHVTLAAGDTIRVIGESVALASGSQFLARLIQKGNQTLVLRSSQGFPLRPATKPGNQQGAL